MKNSLKNALNTLVLLVFIALAWATSKAEIIEPINMEVKINADSTAFLLKNLDNIDYTNGRISLRADSIALFNVFFDLDSVSIKAKAVDTLLFSRFKHFVDRTPFSKRRKLKNFNYTVSPHPAKKNATGIFDFNF